MVDNYNKSHEGVLPIRVLQHNFIVAIEEVLIIKEGNIDALKKKAMELNLSHEVIACMNSKNRGFKIKTPYVKRDSKGISHIVIQETFAAYLWCVICVIYGYSIDIINTNGEKKFLSKEQQILWDYAFSLKDKYSIWDKNRLINPERYSKEYTSFISAVNSIFIDAIRFIFLHEYAHVHLQHLEVSAKFAINSVENKNMEWEADKEAISILNQAFSDMSVEKNNSMKLGVIFALIGTLFLSTTLGSESHPDSDRRILEAVRQLQIEPDKDHMGLILAISIDFWMKKYFDREYKNIDIESWLENCGSFEEYFDKLSRCFN